MIVAGAVIGYGTAFGQLAKSSWPKAYGDQFNSNSWKGTYLDGSIKWATAFPTINFVQQTSNYLAIELDGTIIADSLMGLIALDPNTGSIKWTKPVGDGQHGVHGPAIALDGTIYVTSSDQHLYALDSSGNLKWSFAAVNSVVAPPTIGSDGTIYFGATDNYFYAVNPDGSLCLLWSRRLWIQPEDWRSHL